MGKERIEDECVCFWRLSSDVNERLRELMRYHGDLSRHIDRALISIVLGAVELVPVSSGRTTPGLTVINIERCGLETPYCCPAARLLSGGTCK